MTYSHGWSYSSVCFENLEFLQYQLKSCHLYFMTVVPVSHLNEKLHRWKSSCVSLFCSITTSDAAMRRNGSFSGVSKLGGLMIRKMTLKTGRGQGLRGNRIWGGYTDCQDAGRRTIQSSEIPEWMRIVKVFRPYYKSWSNWLGSSSPTKDAVDAIFIISQWPYRYKRSNTFSIKMLEIKPLLWNFRR